MKYELISPEKYIRLYKENKRGFINRLLSEVKVKGRLGNTVRLDPQNIYHEALINKAKKEWIRAIVMNGVDLKRHLLANKPSDIIRYKIESTLDRVYVINDPSHITTKALIWKQWLEPKESFRDYTSKDTSDEFGSLMDEL